MDTPKGRALRRASEVVDTTAVPTQLQSNPSLSRTPVNVEPVPKDPSHNKGSNHNYQYLTLEPSECNSQASRNAANQQAHASHASSMSNMAMLLNEKSSQIRELYSRLEHRQTEYLQLEKKVMELIGKNCDEGVLSQSRQLFRSHLRELDISLEAELLERNSDHTILFEKEEALRQNGDFRTTKRLDRNKYLEPDKEVPFKESRVSFVSAYRQFAPCKEELQPQFVCTTNQQNCLYQEIRQESDSDGEHECKDDREHQPNEAFTFIGRLSKEPVRLSEPSAELSRTVPQAPPIEEGPILNVFEPPTAKRTDLVLYDEFSFEELRRNLNLLYSPKVSALSSFQITPRQRRNLTHQSRVLDENVSCGSSLQLCKFKRLVKLTQTTLNIVWKVASKHNRLHPNELTTSVLRGLRNDLIEFVGDFNRRYKAFKEQHADVHLFQEESILRLNDMVELAKSIPCEGEEL